MKSSNRGKLKSKTVFVCQQCGKESPKWVGRCPDCGAWNSFVETTVRQKVYNFKAAKRAAQKILYACSWKAWREGYHLPAPDPYAFDILKHSNGSLIRIEDLYDD